MSWKNTWSARILIYFSNHYWKFVFLTMALLLTVPFYRVILTFPHPIVLKCKTVDYTVTHLMISYQRGNKSVTPVTAPLIEFNYEGKTYQILGGAGGHMGAGIDTQVIFNKNDPQNALQFTFWGLLNYILFIRILEFCVFIPSILFAIASIHKRFVDRYGFFYEVPNFTIVKFSVIFIALFLLPLLPNIRKLAFGKTTEGHLTGDYKWFGNEAHNIIAYEVNGHTYQTPAFDDYDASGLDAGTSVPIRYLPSDPSSAVIYTFDVIYLNYWLVVTGFGLIILVGWIYTSTSAGR